MLLRGWWSDRSPPGLTSSQRNTPIKSPSGLSGAFFSRDGLAPFGSPFSGSPWMDRGSAWMRKTMHKWRFRGEFTDARE